MAIGRKTGGRAAGTPNRKTQEVSELLASLGCDPIAGMATIAQDDSHSPELRGRMFAELAKYVHPQRKAIEATIEGGQTTIIFTWGPPAEPKAIPAVAHSRTFELEGDNE